MVYRRTRKTKFSCRTCGKVLPEGRETPTFPFCSKQCKMTDLGRWFSGAYRISEPIQDEDIDELGEQESEQG